MLQKGHIAYWYKVTDGAFTVLFVFVIVEVENDNTDDDDDDDDIGEDKQFVLLRNCRIKKKRVQYCIDLSIFTEIVEAVQEGSSVSYASEHV